MVHKCNTADWLKHTRKELDKVGLSESDYIEVSDALMEHEICACTVPYAPTQPCMCTVAHVPMRMYRSFAGALTWRVLSR